MDGVTTAIVAFIFVGVLFPRIIKNKAQFYGALAAVLLVILLAALAVAVNNAGFMRFAAAAIAVLQIGAIFLLILASGGLTVKDLAGELSDAIEVMRRGDDRKTVIVPLTGQQPKPRSARDEDDSNWATAGTPVAPSPAAKPVDSSVPLE